MASCSVDQRGERARRWDGMRTCLVNDGLGRCVRVPSKGRHLCGFWFMTEELLELHSESGECRKPTRDRLRERKKMDERNNSISQRGCVTPLVIPNHVTTSSSSLPNDHRRSSLSRSSPHVLDIPRVHEITPQRQSPLSAQLAQVCRLPRDEDERRSAWCSTATTSAGTSPGPGSRE